MTVTIKVIHFVIYTSEVIKLLIKIVIYHMNIN